MELLEKIKAELQAFEERKKQLVEDLRREFPVILKPLFEKHDWIETISWTQYTPYFNDGDECTFGVNLYSLNINGKSEYDLDGEALTTFSTAEKEFLSVLKEVPEDFYRDLFGDHAQVIVYFSGEVDVEEYDHD